MGVVVVWGGGVSVLPLNQVCNTEGNTSLHRNDCVHMVLIWNNDWYCIILLQHYQSGMFE